VASCFSESGSQWLADRDSEAQARTNATTRRSSAVKRMRGESLKGDQGQPAVRPWKGQPQGSYLVRSRFGDFKNRGLLWMGKAQKLRPSPPGDNLASRGG
jgi:hypothetical protein